MALVSAHRGGTGDVSSAQNTLEAFEAAIAMGCDYIEFDIRLTADGAPVIFHAAHMPGSGTAHAIAAHPLEKLQEFGIVTLDQVLDLIAGRAKAHVDLKVAGSEIAVVRQIIGALGVADVIITTAEGSSVRRIREWSRIHEPSLLVGLSSGRRSWNGSWWRKRLVTVESLFARTRVRLSRANMVVAHKTMAHYWLGAYARRHSLPLVVWTVDEPDELEHWMNDTHVWLVTTNYPQRAFAARH